MTSNAGIIIYNVKHKEHGDHDVKLLTQVHMTRIWSSEGQPRAFPFLINILFSLMYFSKMLQHSYEVGRVGSISILWMEKLMWRDVFKMLLVNALLGFSWMESLNSEQFGPIVWEEGYASLGRKKPPTFIELLLSTRHSIGCWGGKEKCNLAPWPLEIAVSELAEIVSSKVLFSAIRTIGIWTSNFTSRCPLQRIESS